LLDVDAKINDIVMRVNGEQSRSKNQNNEPMIKEIVLYLIIKHAKYPSLTKEKIESEIINTQQCTMRESRSIFFEICHAVYCQNVSKYFADK